MTLIHEGTDHLTTGWEPALDPHDTMLRRYLAAWTAQCEAFTTSVGGATVVTDRWSWSDAPRPTDLFTALTLLAPPPEDPTSLFDEIEATVDAGGPGEVHLWTAWPTPVLARRGWQLVGHPPLLLRPPASMAGIPSVEGTATTTGVTSDDELDAWERTVVEGFPLGELLPHRPGTLAGPALLVDDRVTLRRGLDPTGSTVSASALFVHDGLSLFALAATRPGARGAGHWRAHAADRLRAAPDLWTAGVFSDLSRPLAEAIGFVPVQRLTLWARPRP